MERLIITAYTPTLVQLAEINEIPNLKQLTFVRNLPAYPYSSQGGTTNLEELDILNRIQSIHFYNMDFNKENIEQFENTAKAFSTEIHIISTETREGVQLRDIGKVGAILRYKVT